ncbi:S1 domain [Sesbania bispinosa]|nr:S1 domain [Sesbania bispinosa]
MGSLPLTSKPFFTTRTHLPLFSSDRRTPPRTVYLNQRTKVFASRSKEEEEPQFDSYDLMELKFGRLLGEDPKLTLAKIMGRKANPDASYLDIEKSFYKNKGKVVEIEEVPFEGSKPRKSSGKLDALGLVRPVPAKGPKFKADDNKVALEIKKPSQRESKEGNVRKSNVPNVILRKPTVYQGDDDEAMSSTLRMRPNLSLKMQSGQVKEKFSDMTLLRKPGPPISNNTDMIQEPSSHLDGDDDIGLKMWKEEPSDEIGNLTLLEQPHRPSGEKEEEQFGDAEVVVPNDVGANLCCNMEFSNGLEQYEQRHQEAHQELTDLSQLSDLNSVGSRTELSVEAALQGKPKRLDQFVEKTSKFVEEETTSPNPGGHRNNKESGNLVDMSDFQESEYADWTRAEDLIKTGDKEDVELVSCSTKGFIVSFGSLVGFLPYRNLVSKWKFLAFESWLRQKGLDPSNSNKVEDKISPDMKLEDLLRIYDQEKIKFLSSFIGQKIKANVLVADRKMRKLIFSLRPKEREELAEKKRNLMARLQVGDIVKCHIQKITYFGIFVEVEGVSALIHQSELSWDATLNPALYFKIGQVVEAKVHQLNFALERIFLSLKEIMPDPLMDSLESVVGDRDPLDGILEAAQTDEEWSEVESLIKELQKIEGVQSVAKGRFFRSPGLAPTFQVYMASIFENQYKLLARSGNRIQEVMVQTSLDKERMKSAIMACANRVE